MAAHAPPEQQRPPPPLAGCSSQETRTLVSKAEGQKGLEHCVRSVAFNASGTHLLSGSDDKAATLWDCASWQRVQEMCVCPAHRAGCLLSQCSGLHWLPVAE